MSFDLSGRKFSVYLSPEGYELLTTCIGYRSESAYGEGYRDFRAVITHEINELGNVSDLDDIRDHLHLPSTIDLDGVLSWIAQHFGNDAKVIWLSTLDGAKEYADHPDTKEDIDQYIIPFGAKLIADIGFDGQLFLMTNQDYEKLLKSMKSLS